MVHTAVHPWNWPEANGTYAGVTYASLLALS